MRWRRRGTLLALIAVLVTGMVVAVALRRPAGGRGLPPGTATHAVGTLRIGVANRPDPPRTGENVMTVALRDAGDRPVRGAAVQIAVSMPAMGAMPYMESRAKVREIAPGLYRGEYGLAMGGDWDVNVRATPPEGAPIQAAFRLSTNMQGLAFVGGSGATAALPETAAVASVDETGAVSMDAARRQALGVRVAPVAMRSLSAVVRAAGQIVYDEALQADVALRFGGWIRELRADYTGRAVRRGEVLFTVYSPELWAAQQEFLDSERATQAGSSDPEAVAAAHDLAHAARQRLRLWDIAEVDIDALARRGRALEAVPVRSPVGGVITEKAVVRGSPFQAGQVLLRVARLDRVWVIASVHQMDLPLLRPGAPARLADVNRDAPGRLGRVSFVYPALDSMTRTARVRIEVANPGARLMPGMFVDVELSTPSAPRLAVPESAVLPTGERHVVFVDLRDGRLAPREVRLGRRAEGYYEVLEGLQPGELVVTSGNFLIAAESRLRSATQKW
jgi:membrane fusion protein, copper/silver efflux system